MSGVAQMLAVTNTSFLCIEIQQAFSVRFCTVPVLWYIISVVTGPSVQESFVLYTPSYEEAARASVYVCEEDGTEFFRTSDVIDTRQSDSFRIDANCTPSKVSHHPRYR